MRQGEHIAQRQLITWANAQAAAIPELRLLFAIPNGGHRNKATAGRLKAEGVKAGVPDLFLPVPRAGYHGLFIEMKVEKNKLTKNQAAWIEALKLQGYLVRVCRGFEDGRATLIDYIGQPSTI